jgi:hypothetical protein
MSFFAVEETLERFRHRRRIARVNQAELCDRLFQFALSPVN